MGSSLAKFYNDSCPNLNLINIANTVNPISCVRVNSLKGQASNSASSTDIYFFNFEDGTHYNGVPVRRGVAKLFVSNIKENNSLIYEDFVYRLVISNLLNYSINPHFVKYLGSAIGIPFNNILSFLSQKNSNRNIDVKRNFIRNIFYTLKKMPGRPALTENEPNRSIFDRGITQADNNFIQVNARYGYIISEALPVVSLRNYNEFNNMNAGISITLQNYINISPILTEGNNRWFKLLMELYFQIATACYAMSLHGLAHNDLHADNIFVTKVDKRINCYYIDGKIYKHETEYMVYIYDFDKSYIFGYKNDDLVKYRSSNISNDLIPNRDFVKTLCYAYRNVFQPQKDNLLDIIAPSRQAREIIEDRYNDPRCFLRGINTDFLESDDYAYFNSMPEIITNLYEKYVKNLDTTRKTPTNVYVCSPSLFKNYDVVPERVSSTIYLLKTDEDEGKEAGELEDLADESEELEEVGGLSDIEELSDEEKEEEDADDFLARNLSPLVL